MGGRNEAAALPAATAARRRMGEQGRAYLTGYLFILPALVYMLVMIGYPILYNIVLSFQDVSVFNLAEGNARPFVGLENYRTVFADTTMPFAVGNTLYYTLCCLVLQFSSGLLLALFFTQKFPFAKPVRGFLLVGWMMPMTVNALLFKYMLAPDAGIVDSILMSLGILKEPVGWLMNQETAIYGPIFANTWVGIPFNMMLLVNGLNSVPDDVYESARIDGAGPLQRFLRITVPLLRPAMMSVLVLGFVYTFKVFDLIFVMTGGGPLYATEVFSTFSYKLSFRQYYFGQGAAVANVQFVILFCIALLYLRLINREEAM